MKTKPYWTDDLARPPALISSPLPEAADVAIVGGGYTGLNAALVLAKNGASVVILERHTMGWGASSRNGGMATTGLKASIRTIFKRYGRELGRVFWQSSLDAIDRIEQVVAEEGIDCDFGRPGHVALAYKPSHFADMQELAGWFGRELDHPVAVVGPADLASEIGSSAFYGGLVDESSGGLNPAKYVLGLAAAAASHGVVLCEQTDVQRLEGPCGAFVVHTNQGRLNVRDVLVATNGYTDNLLPELEPRIFPVGSYIIVTEPLPADLQHQLSPKGRMFYDSKNFLNYFRLTPDGRMLFGGRNNLSTDLDLHDSADRLQRRMVEVFPLLNGVPVTHSWSGQLGVTFDLMPHIGRIGGVHYALGYGGHGVSIATYLGTEAGLLLAGQKRTSPFMEIPHPTKLFYRGRPWFLPFAAIYYRMLDRLS